MLKELLQWVNTNEGFTNILLAASSLILSVIAIIVSIVTARKQNKLALLDHRMKFLDDLESLITKQLPSWEFDLSQISFFDKYTPTYVNVLFNKTIFDFYASVKENCSKVNSLWGDYDYAKRHETCRNKTPEDIEKEIQTTCKDLQNQFFEVRDGWISKYLNI